MPWSHQISNFLQSYSAGIVSGVDNRFCPCVLKGPGRIWFSFYIRKHADENGNNTAFDKKNWNSMIMQEVLRWPQSCWLFPLSCC